MHAIVGVSVLDQSLFGYVELCFVELLEHGIICLKALDRTFGSRGAPKQALDRTFGSRGAPISQNLILLSLPIVPLVRLPVEKLGERAASKGAKKLASLIVSLV